MKFLIKSCLKGLLICSFLSLIISPQIRAAESSDAKDLVSTVQAEAFESQVQNLKAYMEKYETPNQGAKIWYPTGFWDGPSESDMGLKMYNMIFGSPSQYAYWVVKGAEGDRPSAENVTLSTGFGKLMNSVGVIVVLCSVGAYTIGFFARRSIDINYLSPDKEDEGAFVAVRGALGVITTYPLPFLGGLSALQGLTLVVIMLALGFSTATIRFAVPFIISPNMVNYSYPNVKKVLDAVIRSKTCSIKLSNMANKNYGTTLYIRDTDADVEGYKLIANFGPDSEFAPSCGTITIGEYKRPTDLLTTNYGAVSKYLTNQAITTVGRSFINDLWTNDKINLISSALATEQAVNTADFKQYYSVYNGLVTEYETLWTAAIRTEVQKSLTSDLGEGVTATSKYIDTIADVGFFGLATFYTALTVRQSDINQDIANAYDDITNPLWRTLDVSSELNFVESAIDWIKRKFTSTDESIVRVNSTLEKFLHVAALNNTNLTPESKLDLAMTRLTEDGNGSSLLDELRSYLASQIISLTQATENGATFFNPLIELRRIGIVFQNVGTYLATATTLDLPFSSVLDASSDTSNGSKKSELVLGLITKLIIVCSMVGLFMANIIPLMPWGIWVIAAFSYLSHSVISVIAAGWWGIGFTTSSERNFSGNSKEGANILLTLGLKPFLMTVSFFVAMILNTIFGYFISSQINEAATSAYYGTVNIWSFFGQLIFYCMILFIGMMKNLALIWEMSDLCQRMIGFKNTLEDRSHSEAASQVQSITSTLGQNIKASMGPKPKHA